MRVQSPSRFLLVVLLLCVSLNSSVSAATPKLEAGPADPALPSPQQPATMPGGIFVTGHDSDYHAYKGNYNATGAQHILQRAVAYVTFDRPDPRILLVTDVRSPDGDESDPRAGLQAAGFTFDAADYGSGISGLLDLSSIAFADYDVIVVASDFGGWLRQDELDILNERVADVADFVNNGGGLVVLSESGERPLPASYPGTSHNRYAFVPLPISAVAEERYEILVTLTAAGQAMGLASSDVNGNIAHAYLQPNGIMDVIDVDTSGRVLSLAMRGKPLPVYSISGRVTSGGTGVPGISILGQPSGRATTDASGNYRLTGLTTRTYTLAPSSPYWTFAPLTRTVTTPPDRSDFDFVGTATSALYPVIKGPVRGRIGQSYAFSATVVGENIGLPITYTWEASDQTAVSHTGGLADSVRYTWPREGTKRITMTVATSSGVATGVYTTTIIVPPAAIAVQGPDTAVADVASVFTAIVDPITSTLPLVYTWQTEGLPPVYRTGGTHNTVPLTWLSGGNKTVTVTAANAVGTVIGQDTLTVYVAPGELTLLGPQTGRAGYDYTFTASVASDATPPITFEWQATGQAPQSRETGPGDTATYTWTDLGPKTISVTARNSWGTVSASRVVTVGLGLCLPQVQQFARFKLDLPSVRRP